MDHIENNANRPEFNSSERTERRDNLIRDVIPNPLKRSKHLAPFHGRITEGYLYHGTEIHLHTRGLVSALVGLVASNLCLTFKRSQDTNDIEVLDHDAARNLRKSHNCSHMSSKSQIQGSVFVNVIQFFEKPEPVLRRVCSVVRLQSLDDRLRVGMNTFDPGRRSIFEAFPKLKDRKLCVSNIAKRKWTAHCRLMIANRQRVGQMIEHGPEIMKSVTGCERNSFRRNSGASYAKNIFASFRIDLIGDDIRIAGQPPMNFTFQDLQMLIRPL